MSPLYLNIDIISNNINNINETTIYGKILDEKIYRLQIFIKYFTKVN